MFYAVVAGAALLLVSVVWFWSQRSNAGAAPGQRARRRQSVVSPDTELESMSERKPTQFRSVSIDCTNSSPPCQKAIVLDQTRFLLAEAPTLPLPGCNSGACGCAYVHHDDRRTEDRRAGHDMHEAVWQAKGIVNRRSARDRRKSD